MITPGLIKHIRSQLEDGNRPEDIKSKLTNEGAWNESNIDEVFRVVESDFPDLFKVEKKEQVGNSNQAQPEKIYPEKEDANEDEYINSQASTFKAEPENENNENESQKEQQNHPIILTKNFLLKKKIKGFFSGIFALLFILVLILALIHLGFKIGFWEIDVLSYFDLDF